MEELQARQVHIRDEFWDSRLETNTERAIAHQWEQLERTGCIENFRLVAGEREGFREGYFFADSDAFKWLDAAARVYASRPTERLKRRMDAFIALIGRAQAQDGYIYTYNQLLFPDVRWANLQIEHELYCHGHLIEAAVSHFEATGERSLLEIATRAADLLVREFTGAGPEATPGHEEIEIALIRLHHVTQDRRTSIWPGTSSSSAAASAASSSTSGSRTGAWASGRNRCAGAAQPTWPPTPSMKSASSFHRTTSRPSRREICSAST
jgi:hypothetical protein